MKSSSSSIAELLEGEQAGLYSAERELLPLCKTCSVSPVQGFPAYHLSLKLAWRFSKKACIPSYWSSRAKADQNSLLHSKGSNVMGQLQARTMQVRNAILWRSAGIALRLAEHHAKPESVTDASRSQTTPDRCGQLQGINGATAHCSYRKPSDRGISYALLMQSLAFAMAIDDRLAMLRAMERASGMSWFKLTTLLTSPAVCASAAVSLCVQAQLHGQ